MGYTIRQKLNNKRRLIAGLLLCAVWFGGVSPFAGGAFAAAAAQADEIAAKAIASPTPQCRMASTPKPCCCPVSHNSHSKRGQSPTLARACSCSMRPAPVIPDSNPTPARLADSFTPLGLVPASLPLTNVSPRFAVTAALRPAFSLGSPLRSPPRASDIGRAPPVCLSFA